MSLSFENIFDSSFVSAASAMVVVVLGFIASFISERIERQKSLETEKLKEIQRTIYLALNEQKAQVSGDLSAQNSGDTSAGPASVDELDKKISHTINANAASVTRSAQESLSFVSELVNGYHLQALSQAKIQFWFSVSAATVGFFYILLAAYQTTEGSIAIILNVLPGVVIDAVAFLFFKQAEQTRERATALYDRLRQDNQIEDARELVESIEDLRIRSLVKAQIALHMSGLNPKEIDLQSTLLNSKVE